MKEFLETGTGSGLWSSGGVCWESDTVQPVLRCFSPPRHINSVRVSTGSALTALPWPITASHRLRHRCQPPIQTTRSVFSVGQQLSPLKASTEPTATTSSVLLLSAKPLLHPPLINVRFARRFRCCQAYVTCNRATCLTRLDQPLRAPLPRLQPSRLVVTSSDWSRNLTAGHSDCQLHLPSG